MGQFVFASKVKYDTKNGEYIFPENIQALGWMLGLASSAFIPGIAAYQYLRRTRKGKDNTLFEGSIRALPGEAGLTFGGMLRPTPRWGSVKKSQTPNVKKKSPFKHHTITIQTAVN